jgi:hypothetical protein
MSKNISYNSLIRKNNDCFSICLYQLLSIEIIWIVIHCHLYSLFQVRRH